MKTWHYFLLAIIIVIGAWFRMGGIITNSFPFTYDVGRDMLEVSRIVYGHKLTLIGPTTGLTGLFYGPWWYYILSIPFLISGGNPQFVAFFIVFTGILTILFMYYLGKKIEGKSLGLILAFFCSFSPAMVGISSQIWNPNLIPFFVVLVLLLINKIFLINKSNNKYFLALGLLLGLILDLEVVFGAVFIIGVLLSIVILFWNKIKLRSYLYILLGFLFVVLPRFLFEIRHNFIMTRSVIENFNKQPSANNNFFNYDHIIDVLKTLKNLFDATFTGQNAILGFVIILFLLAGLSVYKNIDQKKQFYLKFSSIILLTFFIVLSFFSGAIWSHYLVGIPILYILIASLMISIIRKKIKISVPIIISTLLILFVIYIKDLNVSISLKPSWEGDAAVYRNQLAVIDYIYLNAGGKKFNYVAYTPAVYDYPYQYLFAWYGKNKYGYIPSKEKEKLFFLIIEPEYNHPFLLKEWFVVRNNDGKKIKEKVIKGGVMVQTRIH